MEIIDEAEFEAKLEITLDEAEEWWENLEPEEKATIFINNDTSKSKLKEQTKQSVVEDRN